jgi:hypothetical protein
MAAYVANGASFGEQHFTIIDSCAVSRQVAPTSTGQRQVCGVPLVCGGNFAFGGCASTNGDYEYVSGSEPGMIASGVLSPSRGECYTCAPCGIRFADRSSRSNSGLHTNRHINSNKPSTSAHHRQARRLDSSSPALFSVCSPGAHLLSSTCAHPLSAPCPHYASPPTTILHRHPPT